LWLHLKEEGFIIGDYKIIEEEKMNAIKYIAKVFWCLCVLRVLCGEI
jgi:hypothetical protein